MLTGRLPFPSTEATLQFNYYWPREYETNPQYEQARLLINDVFVPCKFRPTRDQIVSYPYFRHGTYFKSWDSGCFWQVPKTPIGTPKQHEELYYSICREAGIGQDQTGRKNPCVGRTGLFHPLMRGEKAAEIISHVFGTETHDAIMVNPADQAEL